MEVCGLYATVTRNAFQRVTYLNSANGVAAYTYEASSSVLDYLKLKEDNLALQQENALFQTGLVTSFLR
jgi:hypothetical protein